MFKFDAQSVIQFIVDSNLDRENSNIELLKGGRYKRKGLYIKFAVDIDDIDRTRNRSVRDVDMIFFGNTSVFYHVRESHTVTKPQPDMYINSSNHDSCWRHDGFSFLTELYFEMCKEVNPDVAPCELRDISSMVLWAEMRDVTVEYEKNRDEDYGFNITDIIYGKKYGR